MKRMAASAWFLAVGTALAVPARPLYEPPAPPKVAVIDLRDSFWQGVEAPDRNIFFHGDGQLSYSRSQKGFGTWYVEGNVVYFEFNKKYREFRGTIQGSVIQGESWNVTGKRWTSTLQRAPEK